MNHKAILMAAIALVAVLAIMPSDTSEGARTIEIEDGLGNDFVFDGPVDKVVSIGKGVSATIIRIGAVDKIVVTDSYTKTDSDAFFKPLQDRIASGDVAAGGSIYSSGKEQLKTDIIDAADNGFDRAKDVVIITGSDTYRAPIVDFLKEKGFKNILQWNDIKEYDDIEDFAEAISLVCTGSVHPSIERLDYVPDHIEDVLEDNKVPKAEAFYVTYSTNTFKVGNTGSLANSMIAAAGGRSITTDASKTGSTYAANLTDLVASHPGVTIFADNTIASNPERLSDLKKAVGDDVKIVPLKPMWNNYCIESIDGVWTMACAMYPDYFEGDVPSVPEADSKDIVIYAAIGVVVVAVIGGGAYFFMRP